MFRVVVAGVLGALSGGLAVLIARALPGSKDRPGTNRTAVGVLTAVLFVLANQTVAPAIHAWKQRRDVDVLLREDPFYSSILADHPTLREPLRSGLLEALQRPNPAEAATQVGATVLGPVFSKYLPRASDQALLQFTATMIRTLEAIRRRDPQRCYGFLYPARGPMTAVSKEEGADELLQSLRLVVASGRDRPPPVPTEDQVSSSLGSVFAALASHHGADVLLLEHAQAPDVDRAKICALAIDLYSEIARLPPGEAVPLLRYLFSQS